MSKTTEHISELRERWFKDLEGKENSRKDAEILANVLLNKNAHSVAQSSLKGFSKTFDKSFFSINDGEISFTEPEFLMFAYAEHLIETVILTRWEDTTFLGGFIDDENRKVLRLTSENKLESEILINLRNRYKKDIFQLVNRLPDRLDLYVPLTKVLQVIDFEPKELSSFLIVRMEKKGDSFYLGNLSQSLYSIGVQKVDFGERIYLEFFSTDNESLISLLEHLLVGLSKNDFLKIYRRVLGLLESSDRLKQKLAIATLGRLDFEKNPKKLDKAEQYLKNFIGNNDDKLLSTLCYCYNNLISQHSRFSKYLREISLDDHPLTQTQMSTILMWHEKSSKDRGWFKSELSRLKIFTSSNPQISDSIDYLLKNYVESEPEFVEDFLAEWIEEISYAENDQDITKTFSSTCSEFINKQYAYLSKIITQWLNSDQFAKHLAVGHLISQMVVYDEDGGLQKGIELDENIVKDLSQKDILFILYKILGFIIDSSFLCSLTFSLLNNKNTEEVTALVKEAFTDIIIYDYPNRKDFLQKKIKSGNKNKIKVAKDILKQINKYYDQLESLPELKELRPSNHKIRTHQLISRAQQNKMSKEVNKNSIFAHIAQQISLKYGKAWVMYDGNEMGRVSYLSSFSRTYSLPRSITLKPTEYSFQRARWRNITREEL